jgi:hypothetical protein
MDAIAGVFPTSQAAERAVLALRERGLNGSRTTLLCPGTSEMEAARKVPTDDTESPGMGGAVGSVVGGALGLATASIVLPGVGLITVAGMLAAGAVGAATGHEAGETLERKLGTGLPRDELEVYADALRRGRAVVVAGGDTEDELKDIRRTFEESGAESVDAAREDWLVGLREQ